jgi:serine/threonine-protein kinase
MSAVVSPESLLGRELACGETRWSLTQYLASGGLAHLFLARPLGSAPRDVAVAKVLRPEIDDRKDACARFEREARAAIRVKHANVIDVLAPAVRSGSLSWFLAEHLVGVDLADLLASQKRISPARAVRIAVAAGRGLAAAHDAGVVHRDVKPENIFLVHSEDGREIPKIVDFGSAWVSGEDVAVPLNRRITATTGFVGTPGYLAPEQAEGVVGAPSADVYSLGVVLFEALTGGAPFRGRTWVEVVHLHATAPPPPVRGISAALEAAIHRAMAKDPAARYGRMTNFLDALTATPEGGGG